MSPQKPKRRWYRWLPLVLAVLVVGAGSAFQWKASRLRRLSDSEFLDDVIKYNAIIMIHHKPEGVKRQSGSMTPPVKRRWYQFSLRAMFVGVAIISIPLAWVGYSLNWIRQRRALIESGGVDDHSSGILKCDAPYGLWVFGERGYVEMSCEEAKNTELARRLFPEATVLETFDPSNLPGS